MLRWRCPRGLTTLAYAPELAVLVEVIEGMTNIVCCILRYSAEARRYPYETRPPRRPRCSLLP